MSKIRRALGFLIAALVVSVVSATFLLGRGVARVAQIARVVPVVARSPTFTDEDTIVLVHYHKTGSVLSHQLARVLAESVPTGARLVWARGPTSREYPKRRHDATTKCPSYDDGREAVSVGITANTTTTTPTTVFVQTAPDLYCDDVAGVFSGARSDRRGRVATGDNATGIDDGDVDAHVSPHISPRRSTRGVTKIVHLVRNPFEMALSNYYYHAQVPSPERWVFHDDPCEIRYFYEKKSGDNIAGENETHASMADLVLPALTLNITAEMFDRAASTCRSLYRTAPELGGANYYQHLRALDSLRGMRLATSQMVVSAGGATGAAGGDILRMANNIVRLGRAARLSSAMAKSSASTSTSALPDSPGADHLRDGFQVLSMSMEEWISHPYDSMIEFLDFVFGTAEDTLLSNEGKRRVAEGYDRRRREKGNSSAHVTQGKRKNESVMKAFLRSDDVLGPILTVVEGIVNDALNCTKGSCFE